MFPRGRTMTTGAQAAGLQVEDILREEANAIHGEAATNVAGKSGTELYRELNRLDSAALCLSGGGIRSAAFALGVIQALAMHPRPDKQDDQRAGAGTEP